VLKYALAGLEAQVQAVEGRIALLELVDHAQALHVVLEAGRRLVGADGLARRLGVALQAGVERVLAGVAEGRVAQVVRQRDRLDQVLVQAQAARDAAPELRNLERMRQPGAEQVALVVQEHLGLVDQATEGGGVDDAVTVALESVARGGGRLGIAPPAALIWQASVSL